MKKILFAIFAHPDDEAFGPAGTLLTEAASGTELHLITLTNGAGGTNPDNHTDLGMIRLDEWHAAGRLLGAATQHHLGFTDGQLNNTDMITATTTITDIIRRTLSQQTGPVQVELMTGDLNGITGHIDHIVAARAACQVFYRLKAEGLPLSRLRLACIPQSHAPDVNVDWLFMEPGRRDDEIDEIIDARRYRDQIIAIMRAHHSQRGDGDVHIARLGNRLGMNYFIVKR